jgi:hypothetical protein
VLSLDSKLRIPAHVLFTTVEQDAILLDANTNRYFALEEVGARLWELLGQGLDLRAAFQTLLVEYEVTPSELEQDLLELLSHLVEQGLVEVVDG